MTVGRRWRWLWKITFSPRGYRQIPIPEKKFPILGAVSGKKKNSVLGVGSGKKNSVMGTFEKSVLSWVFFEIYY